MFEKKIVDIAGNCITEFIKRLAYTFGTSVPSWAIVEHLDTHAKYNSDGMIMIRLDDFCKAIFYLDYMWLTEVIKHEFGHHFAEKVLGIKDKRKHEIIADLFEKHVDSALIEEGARLIYAGMLYMKAIFKDYASIREAILQSSEKEE